MQISATSLPPVTRIAAQRHVDARGFLSEVWNFSALAREGVQTAFVQENQIYTKSAGTVRGLNFQSPPAVQAKLVRVGRGEILNIAVDIRRGSPTYGHYLRTRLSAENAMQLLIPEGFMHGFSTLADDTDVYYLISAHFAGECACAVRWDDPDLGIDWGIDPARVILSPKDAAAPHFADLRSPFVFESAP